MASGPCAPHQQVEHMAAPTSTAKRFKSPLPKESRPHMARRTTKVAAAALANKTARMVWAIMTSGQTYREPELRTA
jgi:hypothetical protein